MRIGYVVCEVNQASGCVERLADDGLYDTATEAEAVAEEFRSDTARRGRRERYFVAAVTDSESQE